MAVLHCEIVTAERVVFDDNVDMVVAPGVEGQLGILPHHAPLMTALTIGELVLHKAGQEDTIVAIGGGFMEVGPQHVTILADSAERAEEIDEARAEAARRRAETTMTQARGEQEDFIKAEAALRRSILRLKVAKHRPGSRTRSGSPGIGR
jgi:F-type H+-transporting ATPase subunit epsilon